MSTQDILEQLPNLSAEDRAQVSQALHDLKASEPAAAGHSTDDIRPRIPGLHAGAWTVADDFDDPLPDAFWLGEDA